MNNMVEMSLDNYENEGGVSLSSVYTVVFKNSFSEAFSGNGQICQWFNDIRKNEKQLRRFKLECGMGLLSINLRQPATEEHWTIPVVEGFLEYLSTCHVIRDEEYGIDIKDIIHVVGTRLASNDQFFAKFLPASIVTDTWIRFMTASYANIVKYVDVSDSFLDELLDINPDVIRYLPEDKVTMKRAVRAVCAESFNIDYLPEGIKVECAIKSFHKLQVENYNLKSRIEKMLEENILCGVSGL